MGGKNHQPCRVYLMNSTRLSRALSVARAELELANVALEDVLLAEIDGGRAEVAPVTQHLGFSSSALADALDSVAALRRQMRDNRYEDLLILSKLDLKDIGRELDRLGATNLQLWNSVVDMILQDSFYSVLDHFESTIRVLSELTSRLSDRLCRVASQANGGELTLVLEENRQGNFKLTFAQLYTAWSSFDQQFLASSLLSTEAWYRFNRNDGSLVHSESIPATLQGAA